MAFPRSGRFSVIRAADTGVKRINPRKVAGKRAKRNTSQAPREKAINQESLQRKLGSREGGF